MGTLADDKDNAQAHVCVVHFPRKKENKNIFDVVPVIGAVAWSSLLPERTYGSCLPAAVGQQVN